MRVAENLIENAIKYSAPEPGKGDRKVWVGVDAREGLGFLTVRDEGPGIAPENIPRLTERFYRVDVGQSRAKGGTGLGLALVKHILARHRGRLRVQSKLGEGATFTASAPLFD
jgi:two-component system phosphate regulon sensor histidine kinase PhoR